MEGPQCDVAWLCEDYFPREIWMMVLGHMYSVMSPRRYFALSTVNCSWRMMVYESVTAIGAPLVDFLLDSTLKRFGSLRDLAIPGTWKKVTDDGLRTATNLTSLNLYYNRLITNNGITGLTKLTTLVLSDHITDDGLRNLTNLASLTLNSNISDCVVTKLTNLTSLESFNAISVSEVGLKALANLTSLNLRFGSSNYRCYDDALKQLTNLTKLGLTTYKSCNVSDAGIKDLLNLTDLDISDNQFISDTGIENLTNLRILHLCYFKCGITDGGLRNLVNLTSLYLEYNQKISDVGIVGLINLSTLEIRNSQITDNAISRMVGLTSLSLNESNSDAGVANLTNLTKLDLGDSKLLTNAGLIGLTQLKSLRLSYNRDIGDESIKRLTNLTRLSLVPSDNSLVSFECVKLLPNLKDLVGMKSLNLGTDEFARVFNEMPSLMTISFDASKGYLPPTRRFQVVEQ